MENEDKLRDYLKQVTAKLRQTRQRLREVRERDHEPVAIVGMGCRFPGGVRGPGDMWDLLVCGGDAVSEFPVDRGWDLDRPYDTRQGGFVHDVAGFDAGFFGISPREALAMDPQQRLLLEVCWEALEQAGIDPSSLRGSSTGVFAGATHSGYEAGFAEGSDGSEGYLLTGSVTSVISGRIAYVLGLEGPAVTVDTACSSSLVALHLACQALRSEECSVALAGGVAVLATPDAFAEFSRQGGLATDGRCKAFSAAANGTGWAEGAGVLVVERLTDARRNGHQVLAVVRGSAVNQDGASNGLTAPNGPSQERVIRAALTNAELTPADVDVVEGHGTGTTLGDPIEAHALLATYGRGRDAGRPLWLGSVKSNIGHTGAAAGVAGLIKMVLALRRGVLPPTLHAEEPSPHVDWSAGHVRLLTGAVPWPARDGRPRRAGVSAFGISGTNAHAVIEEAPAGDEPRDEPGGPVPVLAAGDTAWVVSGRSAEGLAAQAGRLGEFAAARAELDPADVGWSLATTRSVFEHRAVITGPGRDELLAGVSAVAAGAPAAGAVTGSVPPGGPGRVVLVFPGQGGQWAGMGRELAACSPVFAARLAECGRALAPYVDWSLQEVLADARALQRADVVQPALWAVMVSLAAVWEAAGVVPDAVVGHSQGEIAAACVAGILSLQDAAAVVALRSRALTALAGRGAMASVAGPAGRVRERIARFGDRLSVAAVNGPAATVVSGEPGAVAELAAACEAEGMRARVLPVDYASHSAQVEQLRAEILAALDGIRPGRGRVPMVSAMTGEWADGPELDAGYWYASLRSPVEFDRAVRLLAAAGHGVFIEASPHPVLTTAVTDTAADTPVTATGTLRRDDGGAGRLLASLAQAFVRGTAVNWALVLGGGRRVELPTYAFQHQRYWPEPRRAAVAAGGDGSGSVAEARFWAAIEGGDIAGLAGTLAVDEGRLGELVPALASWRRRERDESATVGWRYRVAWARASDPGPGVLTGTWLVVAPAAPCGTHADGVIRALACGGARTVVVEVGAHELGRAVLAERIGQVAAGEAGITGDGAGSHPVAGVVSLLALNESPVPEHPVIAVGVAGTVALAQALGDAGIGAPLWVITSGAVATESAAPSSPVQAQVWGLGRVVGLEHPERWGGLIDVSAALDNRMGSWLCGVLAGSAEDQVAIQSTGVLVRRLVRAPWPRALKQWAPGGSVLVTGGTGAVGGHVARWVAERGAARVVLASRSGPDAVGVAGLAAELARSGTAVQVMACDVGVRDQVAGLLAWIGASGPGLSSVLHTAGAGYGGALEDLTSDGLAELLAAKTEGAMALDELTAGLDLDAFVLFSSGAATWGSRLLGGYAAANAFLDGLAGNRRGRGLPATSVAWGLWGGGGMGGGEAGAQLQRLGVKVMDPALAVRALGTVLDGGEGNVTVADVDWARFAPVFTVRRPSPLLADLPEAAQALAAANSGTVTASTETDLGRRLAGLAEAEQSRVLTDMVRAEAAAVLGHSAADAVEPGRAFKDLGFDSLTAIELRNRLTGTTGLRLPSTLVFDHPTALAVAGFLRGELLGLSDDVVTPPVAAVSVLEEPVAIVGMGCRFPGGVRGPGDMWDLLVCGGDAVSEFPVDRGWDLEGMYGPDTGDARPYQGGFVYDVAGFDAGFFGISPREALAMDPQQRLLLEVCWEALEQAGIDPSSLRGSSTGVFAGAAFTGYGTDLAEAGSEGYLMTGTALSVISGRVAYALGLEGPAVTVDTACSSSLVALHLACQALRSGECTMALASGVAVLISPGAFSEFALQRGLAADGRCKAFGVAADGIGWSEGAGVVVLERLSDARRNGHQVLAVVRGSAINQDGASNGLTAPNGPSQQRVIRAALASASLTAEDVDAVEAHGTGTTLGDPIEAQALLATYGQAHDRDRPLWLGSIKSNIGHAQTAAGVAGVIKMVLALRHGLLPATLHADEPSPHVDWSAGHVRLLTEAVPWTANGHPRRAGVSAFGVSGTNAHAIVEEAPFFDRPVEQPAVPVASGVGAWVVSGRSAEGLAAQAGRLGEFAAARAELDPADVGWSLATTRSVFEHRAVITGPGRDELLAGVSAVAAGAPAAGAVTGSVPPGGPGRVVLVFPGQGGQWAGMGRELAACSPVFAARLAECGRALAPYVDWSLQEVLADARALQRADVVQPALWAVMVSLAAVWEAAGVVPDAVVGHSQGEIAAACVAGILSLQDAAAVVALRSRALTALAGRGAMASVAGPAGRVRERIARFGDRLSVAAVNGPAATVVSGEPGAVAELAAACEAEGMRARVLPVDYASHSAQVEQLRAEILAALDGIRPGRGRVPMVSAMTGEWADGPELDAGYWYASLRSPVEFDRAVRLLAAAGHGVFIEASPHPVLTTAVTDTAADTPVTATGTLRRDDGGAGRLLASLAQAFVRGTAVNWALVLGGGRRVELPTYAFQHQRYWPEPRRAAVAAGGDGSGSVAEARFWAAIEGGDIAGLAGTLAVDEGRLGELVPALASWRRRERDESATVGWRYRVAWAPVPEPAAVTLSGTWLVVIPADLADGEFATGCLRALDGAKVVCVEAGTDDLDRSVLAGRIGAAVDVNEPMTGVVSLLASDETPLGGHPEVSGGLAGTLALLQALGDAGIDAPMWVITCGAVAAVPGEAAVSPAQGQVWGIGRVAALEHPDRWGGLVDLPPVPDERASRRLRGVLAGCGEDQIAIRGAGLLGRRLVRAPQPRAGKTWQPAGSVLVTGGTGAVGGHVARWLAGRGTRRVVLSSRSGPAAEGAAALAAGLAARGTPVEVIACDTSQRAEVAALLTWINAAGPKLSSVLHAAGAGLAVRLREMTVDGLAGVLAAKAGGAAVLDELTAELGLEAFVLFSSGAATWGSGLLGGYAAANASLDGLAENRRSRGLPAVSVAWGLWGGGGMGGGEAGVQLQRLGVKVMDPAMAVRALGAVLDGGEGNVTVADVDWARFAPVFTVRRPSPLIADLPEVTQALARAAVGDLPGTGTTLANRLAGLAEAEQGRVLTDLVRAEAAAVLGHSSPDAIDPGRAFKDLGFDSLTAVELRDRLTDATGLRLPATLVFDHPNSVAVARLLRGELVGIVTDPAEFPPPVARPASEEPVAIVGLGCRFPGGVRNPGELWDLLAAGRDAVSEFPRDRGWDLQGLYGPDAGAATPYQGGFVYDAPDFDAEFFGISPREALAMDPQQRLLLEVSWEALEQARIDPGSLRGSRTGVFAGATHAGYEAEIADGAAGSEGYVLTGTTTSVISGRVAYALGLEGPAVTVDTACSSSLVALHLASQALRAGECGLALAGGVAVLVTSGAFSEFARQRGLAADGRCKAFSAAADGTGWSEGAGMLVLERLSDARRLGHRVLAVVAGSAVNQDGASNGLTAPNGPSQQRVIRAALENAGLTAGDVNAVEAHGTGTTLGDPIEAQALLAAYGQGRDPGRSLWLGSVKSNIGHTGAAAGAAGLIKMVLALQHGVLPRTLHAEEPSPHVDWSSGAVRLLTEAVPWPANGRPRRAGVSAFGISGTNAHVILQEAPAAERIHAGQPAPVVSGTRAWLVSGRTAAGLAAQAGRLAAHVAARPELDPADVGWSLAATRSVFEHRAVITGTDREALTAGLAAVAAGAPAAGVVSGVAGEPGRVVFVFPGHGAQWAGMGRELAACSPVFAARLAECGRALEPYTGWPLEDVLAGDPGAPDLEREDVLQPALWAVSVALAAVWEAAGVSPDAVVGHSQGEIAAACVAGMLSLQDAAAVVALRSRALAPLAGRGGMASVAEPPAAVRERIAAFGGRLSVAAVNSPAATVVSGDLEALAELTAACRAQGIRVRQVPIGYASHSTQVEAVRARLLGSLDGIRPRQGRVPMVSAATGEFLQGPELDAGYWYASLRSPVEFDRAVRVLAGTGHRVFIEASPHPVLTAAVTQTLDDAGAQAPAVTGTLRRHDGGPARLACSLAEAFVTGAAVDWAAVLGPARRVDLPTYAFQHQRYWPGPGRARADVRSAGLDTVTHPLLGAAVELAGGQGLLFTGRLSLGTHPWLADHVLAGTALLPGTAFLELAMVAGHRAGCARVEELTLEAPLVFPGEGAAQVQVTVGGPDAGGRRALEVYSRREEAAEVRWTRHASGVLTARGDDPQISGGLVVWPPEGAVPVDLTGFYDGLAAGGYGYGPAFQGLRAAWRRGAEVFAEVALPDAAADAGPFGIHPALLDAALHAIGLADVSWGGQPDGVLLPFAWTGVSLHATGASELRARLKRGTGNTLTLAAADSAGAPVISADSVVLRPAAAGQLEAASGTAHDTLFSVEWVRVPVAADPARADNGQVAVIGDDPFGLASALGTRAYPDLTALAAAIGAGERVPEFVLAGLHPDPGAGDPAAAARQVAARVLALVQGFITEGRLEPSRLVLVTRGAVAGLAGERIADLPGAGAWGLVRSAQSENPGRLVLADLEMDAEAVPAVLIAAVTCGEPELAVRNGVVFGRRLARPPDGLLPPRGGQPWRLEVAEPGTLDGLVLAACPQVSGPLGAGRVRVAVRAAGVNFRDVLIGLDMYPGEPVLGSEVAGVVLEAGPGVTGLAQGDRVLGIAPGGFGPVAVTDARLLARVPAGWSFAAAAAVPVAFATAWFGLVDLAGAAAGQRVLVHAATGGVGMAAVAVARYLGLEVYATASPGKHPVLREMGFDEAHIASSRDTGFEARFLAATGGTGMDIVLNSLAGELTDASLRLLPRGGTFVELGKIDPRHAADRPGVARRSFDLGDAGADRLGEILTQVTGLLAAGGLTVLPVRAWDVRRAADALRFMSQARHTGKIVLTIPPDPAAPRAPGTVLVTGGTGSLGGRVARHLAGAGRAAHVVLASRSGPAAADAAALAADLAETGAGVRIVACDAADRGPLAQLLAGCAPTAVVHTAGVIDDGVIGSLTPARVDAVMRPKADAAWHLHELTQGLDLDAFVLFSSTAATFGAPGQGNYAAGNAFLDALAARRRADGLPATSIAWGLWAGTDGMAGRLGAADLDRMSRGGVDALSSEEGLTLLDAAVAGGEALAVGAWLDVAGVRARAARGEDVPAVWRGLAGSPRPRATESAQVDAAGELRRQLAGMQSGDRDRVLLDLVRGHVAAVLGHASGEAVEPGRAFKDLGFDSLTAVELRNRLNAATGLRLPATVVFDHPSPLALVSYLRSELLGDAPSAPEAPAVPAPAAGEPVALVAMSCRFPGGVRDPAGLWELLSEGGDAISDLPRDRGWNVPELYDPDPDHAGTSYAVAGGFIDAAGFDAGFFGISPREALAMDPQQRLLLEVSWEALERAGIDPGTLRGSQTGVFAGAAYSGYAEGQQGELEGHLMTGNAASVISGRVSYALGLEGPAVTVDTACSSSLVALHLACQALRAGECSMALAGGVAVMPSPAVLVGFSRQRALSADGRCKAFSAAADGTGWSEGAGMLVLERLSDARRLGHRVLAVVAGSAVNQDGASNGLTAPNGPSQQRVIETALASAGLSAADVDAVEAHGTGTELGDPIEAQALIAAYGRGRDAGRPLWLGSVKSNIGHAQAAAGVAGLIKTVLALQHGVLPRTLHAEEPSLHVDWSSGTVRLLTEAVPWPANGRPRRAGVSSFGFSGTNAHVIVEEAPEDALASADGGPSPEPPALPLAAGTRAWLVSGRTAAGLAAQAGRLAAHVAARPELDPADVGWSLAATRSVFEHRAVITGTDREALTAGLAAVAAGAPAAGVVSGVAGEPGRVVFVFPGHGAQWAGMGRELAACSPVFAARLAECGRALEPYTGWPLEDVLAGDPGAPDLEREDVLQPALWAVSVALAAVWEAAGVSPDAVVGHSQGEIAAACVAGMLSLQDAAAVVALRSRALAPLAGRGGMASVAEPPAAVRERIAAFGGRLSVAAVNSPAATVVSGDLEALAELTAACRAQGIRVRQVPIGYASHSTQVEAVRARLLGSLDGIRPRQGRVPMVSAATGEFLQGPELDAGYWYASLRSPVEFDRAVRVLAGTGHRVFIEASPHPVLTAAVTQTLDDAGAQAPAVTGTLRRHDGGPARLACSLAEAFVTGAAVDWAAVLGPARRVDLPTYAFQHQRYWPGPGRARADVRSAGLDTVTHPLLGAAVELAGGQGLLFTGRLSLGTHPWLADHVLAGTALLPGTAFLELAMVAGHRAGCARVEELTLEAPLVFPGEGAAQVQVTVGGPDAGGRRALEVYSRREEAAEVRWTRHASGVLTARGDDPQISGGLVVWPPEGAVPVDLTGFYDGLAAGGYGYGPAFQGLRAAWRRGAEVFAEVALPDAAADAGPFGIHPALLDAALHATRLDSGNGTPLGEAPQPVTWTGASLQAVGSSALRVRLTPDGAGGWSLAAADTTGTPVILADTVVLRQLTAEELTAASDRPRDILFGTEWNQVPLAAEDHLAARSAVIGADDLAAALGAEPYPDLTSLTEAIGAGEQAPGTVLACVQTAAGADNPAVAARQAAGQVLALVQGFLMEHGLTSTRLVVVTRGAVAAAPGEGVTDLAAAAVWGLVRSAQSENPGRLVLADLPSGAGPAEFTVLALALTAGEPELAVRDGAAYGRRLTRFGGSLLPPRGGQPWRLEVAEPGTLDGLVLAACPQVSGPLGAGRVRVAVRAAGVNFRDVLIGLDMYPGEPVLGSEVAGVVLEAGPGVTGLAQGDRVLGIAPGGFGPVAVTDARLLARVPAGWSFAAAAAVPVAFATAWFGLVDLAGAAAGQRVLVHAATGGVGMAAVAVARYLGLEVYATASPGKHPVLREMGFDEAHIASSRDTGFEARFLAATGGTGMDIVLNSLAGELTDASLRLLPRGGTFVELGKIDPRHAADRPGVARRSFDLGDAGADRLGEILTQVTGLLAAGGLTVLPVRAWDVRRAADALRFMSQARHTGKIVLTIPPDPAAPRAPGTVLVTGGTGSLGGRVARHLAGAGRAAHVVLASRSGPAAADAAALAADLAETGAGVRIVACDAADRGPLAQLLAGCAPTAVVHTAGVIDDGVIGSLTPARVDAVMRPKADAAWHLHELTQGLDLDAFVLFSSTAATFGAPGQGNYAAGNAFLDALAARRRADGLPATSIAWSDDEQGLALLDAITAGDEALVVRATLDVAGMRARAARGEDVPAVWRGLAGPAPRPRAVAAAGADAADTLRRQLAGMSAGDRDRILRDLIRSHVAAVLGHASAETVEPDRVFSGIGFDSLTAVELRNRLNTATGLRLPATLVFDYPTPIALAEYLGEMIAPGVGRDTNSDAESRIRSALASVPLSRLRDAGLMEALLRLADFHESAVESGRNQVDAIDALDAESLVRMALDSDGDHDDYAGR
jgi:acyl transferase domain-containing protein/D-arabinose 1-dehydrogenase-like Zn-dependent alcohol dehydrogenase/acyl carrier protein/GDP-D-mannose dehydratase